MWPWIFFFHVVPELRDLHFALSPIHRSTQTSPIREYLFLKIYSSVPFRNCYCRKIVELSTCEIEIVTSNFVNFLVWLQDCTALYHQNLVRLSPVVHEETRALRSRSLWCCFVIFLCAVNGCKIHEQISTSLSAEGFWNAYIINIHRWHVLLTSEIIGKVSRAFAHNNLWVIAFQKPPLSFLPILFAYHQL